MLVFAAGLRHLIRQARSESEWIGTLLFGAALGWVAVTVGDGLEGGAILNVFAGQKVGVKQVDEHVWLVTFTHYDLGYLTMRPAGSNRSTIRSVRVCYPSLRPE